MVTHPTVIGVCLHPLMPIEYILPSPSGEPWDTNLIRLLMNHMYDLEKL
jgi:hypothetical protein